MHYAEIEIHGDLMQRWQPAGTRIGNGRAVLGEHVAVAGDLVRQIDAAEAEGIRSLLVVLEGEGGEMTAGLDVYSRLRRFSRSGGHTIAFIRGRCMSTLPLVAAACDRVLMSPEGRFGIHAAHAPAGREKDAEEANAAQVALLAARTPVPRAKLESWTSEVDAVVDVHAAGSVRLGLADAEATLEAARSIAEALGLDRHALDGPRYVTKRSTYLATQVAAHMSRDLTTVAPGVACGHNTQSSDGALPQWPTYSAEQRLHEAAARNWTARSGQIGSGLFDVAWSGSRACVVGSSTCATSDDGATWTSRSIPAGTYDAICWSGSLFVAVGTSVCATSPDGVTWTARTIPAGTYRAIVWSGSLFVAVGNGPVCATSTDGVTWTSRSIPGTGDYYSIAWNGTVFCAIGQLVATSPDGITWTARSGGTGNALAWNGSVFCVVGNAGAVKTSVDGITWTTETTPSEAASRNYAAVAWSGQIFCALNSSGGAGMAAPLTSPDGKVWTIQTIGMPSSGYQGIVWTGTMFIAAAAGVDTSGSI